MDWTKVLRIGSIFVGGGLLAIAHAHLLGTVGDELLTLLASALPAWLANSPLKSGQP